MTNTMPHITGWQQSNPIIILSVIWHFTCGTRTYVLPTRDQTLTHWSLVTPYGVIQLCQNWFFTKPLIEPMLPVRQWDDQKHLTKIRFKTECLFKGMHLKISSPKCQNFFSPNCVHILPTHGNPVTNRWKTTKSLQCVLTLPHLQRLLMIVFFIYKQHLQIIRVIRHRMGMKNLVLVCIYWWIIFHRHARFRMYRCVWYERNCGHILFAYCHLKLLKWHV